VGTSPPPTLTPTPDKVQPSVSGGGWISSPAGAYAGDPTVSGKASFGFVVRADKGASGPTGSLDFHLKGTKLHLHAARFESFEVQGGKATLQGVGTLKITAAKGDHDDSQGRKDKEKKQSCGFLVTIVDGQLGGDRGPDLFRIKIWDLDGANPIVYDSQIGDADAADPTTQLDGGSIVIHTGE
jgi:hypothetical protein